MVAKKTTTTKKAAKETKAVKPASKLMMTVYDLAGKEVRSEVLDAHIFGHKDNTALLAQYMRVYLQNQRQGTVSAKTRGEVIGTTQKVYRQKGTGRARHGAAKANLFRGGGVTFGPRPRTFSLSLNKKQKKSALFISLSQKARMGAIKGLDAKDMGTKPSTKTVATFLNNTNLTDKKVLFILPKIEKTPFIQSVSNIKKATVIQGSTINPYVIANNDSIVFVESALKKVTDHFSKTP